MEASKASADNDFELATAEAPAPIKKKYELRAVYGKTQGKIRLCPAKDRNTGRLLGVDRLSPEQERNALHVVKENYQREIWDGLVLDEHNEIDEIDVKWLFFLPEIAQSQEEAAQEPRTLFYVHDEDAINERELLRQNAVMLALNAINNSSSSLQRQILRIMGQVTLGMSDSGVKAHLNSMVLDNKVPADNKKFAMQIVEASKELSEGDGKLKLAILEMIDHRVIKQDPSVGFTYGSINLGSNVQAAMRYLNNPDNQALAAQMTRQLKEAKG